LPTGIHPSTTGKPLAIKVATASQVVIDKVTKYVKGPMVIPGQILHRHKGYIVNLALPKLDGAGNIARFPKGDGDISTRTVQ
jgi:hypothetical protein